MLFGTSRQNFLSFEFNRAADDDAKMHSVNLFLNWIFIFILNKPNVVQPLSLNQRNIKYNLINQPSMPIPTKLWSSDFARTFRCIAKNVRWSELPSLRFFAQHRHQSPEYILYTDIVDKRSAGEFVYTVQIHRKCQRCTLHECYTVQLRIYGSKLMNLNKWMK